MPHPPTHQPLGLPFIELQSVDSTNNYARQEIHAELSKHGTAIFAHEQTAGKGQRGKVWASEKGANIALSIILNPQPLLVSQQFQLSACVAVAAHTFFANYAGEDTKIKWPNDLYWQDKKAGGILIESIISSSQASAGQWQWAIAGIGININQVSFSPELPNPVSLKQITGKSFDPVSLAKEFCLVLDETYSLLLNKGFGPIHTAYLQHLYKNNEKVKFRKDNRVFEAEVKTVLPSGRLVVQHAIEEEFDFGEVEWLLR